MLLNLLVSGIAVPAFGAPLNGTEFKVRLSGGATTTITLSATPADHASISTLIIELNTMLPAGVVAAAGTIADSFKLTVAIDSAAYRKGWGKSLELIDFTPGDLAALGHIAGLTVSAQEPSIEVAITRPDIGLNETLDVNSDIALQIGYLGTTATLTINQTTKLLTTTVVGGLGASLSVDLSQFATIADLVSFIATQTGYSVSNPASAQQLSPSKLDEVTAIGICSTVASLKPGRVKRAAYNFQKVLGTSRALEFVPTATAGVPNPMASAAYLALGARGNTLAADIVDAIEKLAGININMVIPLFSRDASADITDGFTASGSTYTINAINALVKSHCLQYSTPKLKRNRICMLSYWNDSYSEAKDSAQGLAHYRSSLAMQKVAQVNSVGEIVTFLPWYLACIASGMQAGGFYKAIVNKFANVISLVDPSGFDSSSPGDVEDALEAGLLFLTTELPGKMGKAIKLHMVRYKLRL